jgi:pullulanase
MSITKNVVIKASNNEIFIDHLFEVVAVEYQEDNRLKVLDNFTWEVYPNYEVTQENNLFTFHLAPKSINFFRKKQQNYNNGDEITIKGYQATTGISISRVFKINTRTLKGKLIHFIQPNLEYSGSNFSWDLWTYNQDGINASAQNFEFESDYGLVSEVNKDYVIARKKSWGDHWFHEWTEQTSSFKLEDKVTNYYIINGQHKLFTHLAEIILCLNPCIEFAVMDDASQIKAYLSHPPLSDTNFSLVINQELCTNVHYTILHKEITFNHLPHHIAANDLLEIRASKTYPPRKVLMRKYLDNFSYDKDDLGVTFKQKTIQLKLWAPTAIKAEIMIYFTKDQEIEHPSFTYAMDYEPKHGLYTAQIEQMNHENRYYLYKLYFYEINLHGECAITTNYVMDPYAIGASVNGQRGVLLNINSNAVTPRQWYDENKLHIKWQDEFCNPIIYELHVRDFTWHESSGINKLFRGKFMGLTQSDTVYTNHENTMKVTTGIDHLVELGITHVHLLPIFDFATVDESIADEENQRNWGYDPQNYNLPEGSYSLNPYDAGFRIFETRMMINKFHVNGIKVIMDMVYNHMYSTEYLDKIVPGYYFRSDEYGKLTNGSGCGNELATERKMAGKLVVDSILHWQKNYKIDGIRLDLMELIDFDTMQTIVKKTQVINDKFLIYGEPWKAGYSPLQNGTYKTRQKNHKFAIFNDVFRDAIRGDNNLSHGFISGQPHNYNINLNIIEGLKGSINTLMAHPLESINYVDAHDNYTLWDQIEKSHFQHIVSGKFQANINDNILDNVLVRKNLLGLTIVLLAQGVPFLHGGVELLRSKQGEHNSYKGNDGINMMQWANKLKYKVVFDYIKGLIQLRKLHPAFNIQSSQEILKHVHVYPAHNDIGSGVIIYHLKDYPNSDTWNNIIIIFNATSIDDYEINNLVPQAIWNIVVNHHIAGTEIIAVAQKGELPKMKAHSVLVIYN